MKGRSSHWFEHSGFEVLVRFRVKARGLHLIGLLPVDRPR